ncbi:hypothetical protein KL86DES1_10346 [uncultured Desulfovibrio sp.]|uniref:Uncharacterized protein n=1 Tax=uncultured Desulfovibrio sp. TaxID=167968 RepID=A0A212KYH8_9BACT|nr:hypothetical protein KL86DES1_10346 [uncultured Desulfovibrio sp.]VZH32220.1 conserved protein of unknown function [Desulfovibrio sp. 86]
MTNAFHTTASVVSGGELRWRGGGLADGIFDKDQAVVKHLGQRVWAMLFHGS